MVKLCSYNARGLGGYQKRKQLFYLLKHKKIDITMIQESHATDGQMHLWRAQWGGEILYANGTSQSKGILMLMRRGLSFSIEKVVRDPVGRYVVTEIEIEGSHVVLATLYAPNVDSASFFKEVATQIEGLNNRSIVLCGDFNFAVDPEIDRKETYCNNDKARDAFMAYAEFAGLSDVWRVLNPETRQYSCCRPDSYSGQWNKFSRIDMFFISDSLMNCVKQCRMQTGFQSDHSFVILEIDLAPVDRGPGFWKFNTAHLHDKAYVQGANAIIDEAINESDIAPHLKWDLIKGKLVQFSKQYGIDKAKQQREELNQLHKQSDRLKAQIEGLPYPPEEAFENQKKVQKEIANYVQKKVDGIIIRSRVKFFEEGERSSKYYFSLEKNNAKIKTMRQIKNNQGQIVKDSKQILNEQLRFYRKLYTANPQIKFKLQNKTQNKLSEANRLELESELTYEEITASVKQMPNGKSPGLDGLVIEVYKMFWNKLGKEYFRALRHLKELGQLTHQFRRGLITLIPKKNRDTLFLNNWRPLTMLTCDYKILAKTLALRMQRVLHEIISVDQTGYMKGRNITDNIRKTIEVLAVTQNRNDPYIIMNLDFYKCFDTIEHSAIWGSLAYLGFGEKFISWIQLLFKDFELCTQNNGFFSEFFPSQRSVHQGCPVAGYLQICCAQILHDKLTQNPDVVGIPVHEVELLLAQFADDTTLFLTYSKKCLKAVLATLEIVYENIGFSVNYDKTNIYRIGSLAGSDAQIYTTHLLNWTNEPIDLLGIKIPLSLDEQETSMLNFQDVIDKAKEVLSQWAMRSFTLSGRVLLVNTLIASLFVYKMQVLPDMSRQCLSEINTLVIQYLWKDKRPKITSRLLTKDKSQGGLRLVDFSHRQNSLKAQWIIKCHQDHFWMSCLQSNLNTRIGKELFNCNLAPQHARLVFSEWYESFWFDVFQAWCHYNFVSLTNMRNHVEQRIWLNSNILIKNKPVLNEKAVCAGLSRIEHLLDEQGSLLV